MEHCEDRPGQLLFGVAALTALGVERYVHVVGYVLGTTLLPIAITVLASEPVFVEDGIRTMHF
jgi:hypothetical protein